MDKTLLHLALRQDEAKLQKQRRRERWMICVFSAGVISGMTIFFAMMIYTRDRNAMTVWDYALTIVGGAAALLGGGVMYVNHKGQARREPRFGDSLRDQLARRIAQLDDAATRARRTSVLVFVVMGGICPTAILILSHRVNQKAISDDGYMLVTLMIVCIWSVASGVWELRRSVQRDIVPRKHRLEALLKELDAA